MGIQYPAFAEMGYLTRLFCLFLYTRILTVIGNECCQQKRLGKDVYHFIKKSNEDKLKNNCITDCVYEKQDEPNSRYCFKSGGNEMPVCENSETRIVVAGGLDQKSTQSNKTKLLFEKDSDCHPPSLPGQFLTYPSLALTPDGVLLKCGGDEYGQGGYGSQKCYSLDVASNVWTKHSSLTQPRFAAVAITLLSGTYIFGGVYSPTSSDYLPASKKFWQLGPNIPGDRGPNCGVKLSDTELLLISGSNVFKYSESNNKMERMPSLHPNTEGWLNCALFGNNVIVISNNKLNTQIIPLNNYQPQAANGSNPILPEDAKLITVGGRYPRLLTIGGLIDNVLTPIIYEWDEDTELWMRTTLKNEYNLLYQPALAVPPASVCNIK